MTFHYLFPQLTIGLAPLIVVLKTLAIRAGNETYNESARFWTRIFGINFALVSSPHPHGISVRHQLAQFSRLTEAHRQPLAMEGTFLSSWSRHSWAVSVRRKTPGKWGTGAGSWCSSGHGSQGSLSSSPTHGCSIQWPTRACPMEVQCFQLLGTLDQPWR